MSVTQPGRVIAGRYRLLTQLGSGGAGVVWRARDQLLDRDVAVKDISRPALDADSWSESYQRTMREARAAARISHPGVAAVYDVVASADDGLCIVMELIDGRPLSDLIAEAAPLGPPAVADIGSQVLAALMAGHAAGVLHRDLKPANVLITPAGRAVLTDFGIATLTDDKSITRTGVVLGTPGYVAPERVHGEPATPAADLWSLGATLYAAAAGAGPYDGYDGVIATMYAIATSDPPTLPAGGPLGELIGRLMSRDARLRPSAAETAQALAEATVDVAGVPPVAADAPLSAPAPAPPPLAAPPPPAEISAPTISSELLAPLPLPVPEPSQDPDPGGLVPGRRPRSPRHFSRGARTGAFAAVGAVAVAVIVVATLSTAKPSKAGDTAFGPSSPAAPVSVAPAVTEQFRVAAALTAGNSPELFAVAKNGTLEADAYAGGTWGGWQPLPGGSTFTGVPAAALAKDGRLMVFARGTTGVTEYFYQSGGNWTGPVRLGDRPVTSSPAVVAWPDGHLEVFARLADGTLGQAAQRGTASTAGWSGWTSLGGHLAGPPQVALDGSGDPQVFALGPNGGLGVDAYANGGWQGWRALPGGDQYTGMPAVGMNEDGRLEVFARSTAGAIEHVWQNPGKLTQWGGPLTLFPSAAGDPEVFNTKGGRMEVFVQAPGGTVEHSWQLQPVAGTGWAHPASLDGSSDGAPVPLWVGTESELFTRTPAGAIAWDHLVSAQAGWTGWSGMGGGF